MSDDRLVLEVPEAGAKLGLGRNASYAAAKRGDIPTIKIGRLFESPRPGARGDAERRIEAAAMIRNSEASGEAVALPAYSIVVARDDGLFQIGLCDDADGPFPDRAFAQAVAAKEARHLPQWGRQ